MTKQTNPSWQNFMSWHIGRQKKRCTELNFPFTDYMEFPVQWDRIQCPLHEFFQSLFCVYVNEVKEWKRDSSVNVDIETIEDVCEQIVKVIKLKSYVGSDNESISCDEYLGPLWSTLKLDHYIGYLDSNETVFYRIRSGIGHNQEKDFYHTPFDKLYLCGTCRFTPAGKQGLYVGYTEDVCKVEIQRTGASVAKLTLCGENKFKIIDLTFKNQCVENINMFYMWPFLAACYVAVDKEPEVVNFKEEYLFPQEFMRYAMSHCEGIVGVKYYSTREKDLNPQNNHYCNLAFFAKNDGNSKYDMKLMNSFKISGFHNI